MNWRLHPKRQEEALAGALSQVGWVQTIMLNQRTGNMIDGHLRVKLALRRHEPEVPIIIVDLSEIEERMVLATLDPIAGMAGTDNDRLKALLSEIETTDASVQSMFDQMP
jgi:ParB-like chromosome segregation protein Spo0J